MNGQAQQGRNDTKKNADDIGKIKAIENGLETAQNNPPEELDKFSITVAYSTKKQYAEIRRNSNSIK